MKNKTMTKDEFAVFIANVILTDIQMYQFDVLYDISKIVQLLGEKRANNEDPQTEELHLMTRSTGCDLVSPTNDYYKTHETNSKKIYKLRFCWNEDYMRKEHFCTIIKITTKN